MYSSGHICPTGQTYLPGHLSTWTPIHLDTYLGKKDSQNCCPKTGQKYMDKNCGLKGCPKIGQKNIRKKVGQNPTQSMSAIMWPDDRKGGAKNCK